MRSKTKTSRALYALFFPRVEYITGNTKELWFIAQFVSVVICPSNYFGIGFSDYHLKTV